MPLDYNKMETLVNELKGKLEEQQGALVSDDLLAILSLYKTASDEYETNETELSKVKADNENLLKVNGKLFQQIGFPDKHKEDEDNEDDDEPKLSIKDLIDEKGNFIKEK